MLTDDVLLIMPYKQRPSWHFVFAQQVNWLNAVSIHLAHLYNELNLYYLKEK